MPLLQDDCFDDVGTPYPVLKSTPSIIMGLYLQKKLLCVIEHPETAVLYMLYTYWVFDISFPKELVKTFSFLAYLLGITCDNTSKVQNMINQLKFDGEVA